VSLVKPFILKVASIKDNTKANY